MGLETEIGQKLKEIRMKRGYTVREVGEKTGMSFTYVSKIENGQKSSLDTLEKLCDFYNVPIQSLFGKEVETPKELEGKVKWIAFGQEMEEDDLTPEDIKSILKFLRKRSEKE
ncbi:helix-turn-helix domain-containing protein [Virgibacillus salexigens]|uniref:HTH cro/C1-type domain-containing protein n=1 Tax=Virgibacillus kapii TaxID=1638645 RepID=A0ABQ2D7M6_9BACI|nr:helix-turn-helix transcriptional regulator [Virgibacillus kapii]GGJ48943.1 hypothetical protein GCM10007111_08760 [Virgibacillus kapii]